MYVYLMVFIDWFNYIRTTKLWTSVQSFYRKHLYDHVAEMLYILLKFFLPREQIISTIIDNERNFWKLLKYLVVICKNKMLVVIKAFYFMYIDLLINVYCWTIDIVERRKPLSLIFTVIENNNHLGNRIVIIVSFPSQF